MGTQIHLVTGGSGFIGIHIVAKLLETDHTVHATIRSTKHGPKIQPLQDLQKKYPGKLNLFDADLLQPGSFAAAMQGCSVVHHVASPFLMAEKIRDGEKEMVEPALQGTRNVLTCVNNTESVKRVVLTSTGKILHVNVRAFHRLGLGFVLTRLHSTLSRCHFWGLH